MVIVGAGYTGLWTAYYLAAADPSLRIVVLEARTAGFGASGRNGGWCSALFPASAAALAALPGSSRDRAAAMHRTMTASVDEVGRVTVAEGIDCHYHRGGTVVLARSATQWARAQQEVAAARSWGRDDLRLLDARETAEQVRATNVLGSTYTPHCAAIHPLRLAWPRPCSGAA
jgi:glycine/D-amino acid oxidase-like deaminating enzyme